MKVVPIKRRSSISVIALKSLRRKKCILCDDPIPDLDAAYDHAWDHWDLWREKQRENPLQLRLF